MPTATYGGRAVDVDNDGFLANPDDWSRDLGAAIASADGITLGDDHWKVIDFARADYKEKGVSPGPRRITTGSGVNMKTLYQLFPKGPGKLIAKVAGIPKPKACL